MSQNYKPIITILGSLQQTQLKGNMFDIWQEDTYLSFTHLSIKMLCSVKGVTDNTSTTQHTI